MAPAVLELLPHGRVAIGVGPFRGDGDGLGVAEVGIAKAQVVHALVVIEDLRDRVDLGDVEETTGPDEMSGDPRPPFDVR